MKAKLHSKKIFLKHLWAAILIFTTTQVIAQKQYVLSVNDIHIRDPFVYADTQTKTYYMYASKDTIINGINHGGVIVYKSKDLKKWQQPIRVFTTPNDNWTMGRVWAPEMHVYQNKYYLFLTLNSDIEWKKRQEGWPPYVFRGVQIMQGDSPEGPFNPITPYPTTPSDEMALDGTLYIENGQPWLIYCNEWVQRIDGTIRLAKLSSDLSHIESMPTDLFHASAAPWSTGSPNHDLRSYVTDGCYPWKTKNKLFMIWSSFMNGNYALGVATSTTGLITGPWIQAQEPLFKEDGGHGMIFKAFDERLLLALHKPNRGGKERAHFFEIIDNGNTLTLSKSQ